MKRFLRHAACAAAMLLLTACPVKALAANITQIQGNAGMETLAGAPTKGNEGHSTFKIEQVELYQYVSLTVIDDDENIPLSGINVQLSEVGAAEGFQGGNIGDTSIPGNTTGPDGKIWFRFPKGQSACRVLLEHEGFVKFDQTFPLTGKITNLDGLRFKPIFFDIYYYSDWRGEIPEGEAQTLARWGRAPKEVPDLTVNPGYSLDYWVDQDGAQIKDLSRLKVYKELKLTAHYSRQYLVKYEAGDYGYLDGELQEYVVVGEKPKHVPTPVPIFARDYWFVKWRIADSFSDKSVDPASVVITGDTTFKAVFGVRKPQPVIITTPATGQDSNAPTSEPSAAIPAIGGIGGGPGGGSGASRGGGGQGTEVPSSAQTQPSGQEGAPGQEGTEPEHPGEKPPGDAAVQAAPAAQSSRQSPIILLCCLLTLVAGALRLTVIHRTIKCLEHPKEGDDTHFTSFKPIVTEAILGIICVILWGSFYVRCSISGGLTALVLWAAVQAAMAVLLIRAERSLRYAAEKNES